VGCGKFPVKVCRENQNAFIPKIVVSENTTDAM
jgi:hypothetical protein